MDDLFNMFVCVQHLERPTSLLNPREFTYLYALTKQIVVEESKYGIQHLRVKFPEMVEMIARVANFKYDNSPQEKLGLPKHIEMVLNDLFMAHLNQGIKTTDDLVESDASSAESEEDY